MTPADKITLRKALGLTQAKLAARLGVSRRTIIRAEDDDGEAMPLLETVYCLLAALGAQAGEALVDRSRNP